MEEEYYNIPSPSSQYPLLSSIVYSIYTPSDKSYGRWALPLSPREEKIQQDERFSYELKRQFDGKGDWTAWWEVEWKERRRERGHYGTFVFCHGINDYGGKFTEHCLPFLESGYRLILPDCPSHGRSSGFHVYFKDADVAVEAVRKVLEEIHQNDLEKGEGDESGKWFIGGCSFGGWVAANVAHSMETMKSRPQLSGILLLAPMFGVKKDSRPSKVVEWFARCLAYVAGGIPLAEANRGKSTVKKEIEEEFLKDPQTYHGRLRIGTGLAILKALEDGQERMKQVETSLKIWHGLRDRVTDWKESERLIELIKEKGVDAQVQLVDEGEHVLLVDDEIRRVILREMIDWMDHRLFV